MSFIEAVKVIEILRDQRNLPIFIGFGGNFWEKIAKCLINFGKIAIDFRVSVIVKESWMKDKRILGMWIIL